MKKIIQIAVSDDDLFCLTEDGKVYDRRLKNKKKVTEPPSKKHPNGRVYVTGTLYWKEVPLEENF